MMLAACYVMKIERQMYVIFKVYQISGWYISNISRYVNSSEKISGLKSHNCHVLLQ